MEQGPTTTTRRGSWPWRTARMASRAALTAAAVSGGTGSSVFTFRGVRSGVTAVTFRSSSPSVLGAATGQDLYGLRANSTRLPTASGDSSEQRNCYPGLAGLMQAQASNGRSDTDGGLHVRTQSFAIEEGPADRWRTSA